MRAWKKLGALVLTVGLLGLGAGTDGAAAVTRHRNIATFSVASFNILGSNHTVNSTRWQPGTTRARLALRWLDQQGTSVMGVQEAQVDQMQVLTHTGVWSSYPDPRTAKNSQTAQSVAWRTDRWTLVRASTFTIPFDRTQIREQPMVLLKDKVSGRAVWFVSVHLTSGGGDRAKYERQVGTEAIAANVRTLEATRHAVVVTGDMNDHAGFFCSITSTTTLVSPAGGTNVGGVCTPPRVMRIDWILGSSLLRWSGFRFAEDSLLSRITDHDVPMVTA